MLSVCDRFAQKYNIVFNAKKSKCICTLIHVRADRLHTVSTLPRFSVTVGGNVIEFVDEWPHLGHIITATSDDKADIIRRRSVLCGEINNVLCFFGERDPVTKLSLLKTYCSCFTGVFCGTCQTLLSIPFVSSGARVSGVGYLESST